MSDWRRSEGGFQLAVEIPPNVTATVVLPAGDGALTESGVDVEHVPGVHSAKVEEGRWWLELGSGAYALDLAPGTAERPPSRAPVDEELRPD